MPELSIIIPVYNVEPYLRECLDSALGQTRKDIEVICVNDGSTDGSAAILDEYAAADSRVRVITQPNAGLSAARNTGMDAAEGRYLLFLDSDDKLELYAGDFLCRIAEENTLDVLYFDAETFFETPELAAARGDYAAYYSRESVYGGVYNGEALFFRLMEDGAYRVSAPLQLIRRDFLMQSGVRFPVGLLQEDNAFTTELILLAERVSHRNAPLYLRRIRENSIMTVPKRFDHFYGYFSCAGELRRFGEGLALSAGARSALDRFIGEMYAAAADVYRVLPAPERARSVLMTEEERQVLQTLCREDAAARETPAVWPPDLPLISVVMPVYNVERYLPQAVESVLCQTLPNFELICVDDGSTDASPALLEDYARRDGRVRLLRQQNRYAGAARNAGMEIMRGKYVLFVDSDDFIEPDTLALLWERAEADQADMVLLGRDDYYDEGNRFSPAPWMLRQNLLPDTLPFDRNDLGDDILYIAAPNPAKLFRCDFLRKKGVTFPELRNSEDLTVTLFALAAAERISAVAPERALYHYRRNRVGSLETTTKATSPLDFYTAFEILRRWLEEAGLYEAVERSFTRRLVSSFLYALGSMSDREALEQVEDRFYDDIYPRYALASKGPGYYWLPEDYDGIAEAMQRVESRRAARREAREIKVSVVVPVYNAAPYLPQCLDSLLAQSLRETEVICVNDGSTDESADILRDYARRDGRIRVLTQPNSGAGVARNLGLSHAKGKYVLFLDADDFFDPLLLYSAYARAESQTAQVCLFPADTYDDRSGARAAYYPALDPGLLPRQALFSTADVSDRLFQLTSGAPWNKLFLREYIQSLGTAFQSLPRANDMFFVYTALARAERITALSGAPLVHYRTNSSGSLQATNDCSPLCYLEALEAIREQLLAWDLYPAFRDSFVSALLSNTVYNASILRRPDSVTRLWRALEESWLPVLAAEGVDTGKLDKERRAFYHLLRQRGAAETEHRPAPRLAMAKPKISVIIPVYNVEAYLAECLDSVLRQTLTDIEILCVNDGSPDGSAAILAEYAARDPRIRVLNRPNGGLSAARNTGMEAVTGEYTLFLDSDDTLDTEALAKLYETAEADRLDLLLFGGENFQDGCLLGQGDDHYFERRFSFSAPVSGQEALGAMCEINNFCAPVYVMLIRSAFLRDSGVWFYPGMVHEDELFTPSLLLKARRVSVIPDAFYRHRVRPDSITTHASVLPSIHGYAVARTELAHALHDPALTPEGQAGLAERLQSLDWAVVSRMEKCPEDYLLALRLAFTPAQMDVYQTLFNRFRLERSKKWLETQRAATVPAGDAAARQEEVDRLASQVEEYRTSTSYRLGRALLFIPTKLRGGVRCLREHGLGYTLRYFWRVKLRRRPL